MEIDTEAPVKANNENTSQLLQGRKRKRSGDSDGDAGGEDGIGLSNPKRQQVGSKTCLIGMDTEVGVIIAGEGKLTDLDTNAVVEDDMMKIFCLLDCGIYWTAAGSSVQIKRIFDQVENHYPSTERVENPMVIANYIKKYLLEVDDHLEIALGGVGRNRKLQLVQLIKPAGFKGNTRHTVVKSVKAVAMGSGSASVKTAIPNGSREEKMLEVINRLHIASLGDWSCGGIIICICIFMDENVPMVTRMVAFPENRWRCRLGYKNPPFSQTEEVDEENDTDGYAMYH